jgi:hypothetical protein
MNILIVEDVPTDAELSEREVRKVLDHASSWWKRRLP